MKLSFDCYSEIGQTHKDNQDFSVVGDESCPFIVVSDGCSGAKHSDIGSRVLSLSAAKNMRESFPENPKELSFLGTKSIWRASSIINSLGLDRSCLDATLLIAIIIDGHIHFRLWGDGNIYYKYKDKDLSWINVSYTPEIPYYPSYELDDELNDRYKRKVLQKEIVKTVTSQRDQHIVIDRDPLSPTLNDYEHDFPIDGLEYFLLSTDGTETFLQNGDPMDQGEVVKELTSFKSLHGQFVGKRMNKMLKSFGKQGIIHYDDCTVAGISIRNPDQ